MGSSEAAGGSSETLVADPPNVIIILTDDQRLQGTMVAMPKTLALFDQQGTEFTHPYSATPLCCPARGSIRSGLYAHNHGVLTNWSADQQQAYDQSRTIEATLRGAGYATAIVGKYWNDWPLSQNPPNWDKWATFSGGYNNMSFNVNGSTAVRQGYTTDVMWTYANQFITGFESNDAQPWYLYLAPQAPHSPVTPQAQYRSTPFADIPFTPAMAETDRGDKPSWVVGSGHQYTATQVNNLAKPQLRTLQSVDDLVSSLFARLTALGETNTIAIFSSDNGYMWGEHGLDAKRWPYTDSIAIPIYMRWPGHIAAGVDDPKMVSHIDFAPTIYDATGVVPSYTPDGVSMLSAGARQQAYLEYYRSPDSMTARTWASIVTPTYQYIEWYDDAGTTITFREYYDMVADPWQLTNLLGDSSTANDPDVSTLHTQLAGYRVCRGSSCPQPVVSVPDTQAPSVPSTPTASSNSPGTATATWAASTDDHSTTIIYHVYRGATLVGSMASSSTGSVSFTETGLAEGSTVSYAVSAEDSSGNVSAQSGTSNPTVVSTTPPPPPSIFSDDFSAGFGAWTQNSSMTLDTTIGSAAAPSARADANNTMRFLDKTLPAPLNEVCVAANFNLASIGASQTVSFIRFRSGTNAAVGRVYVNATRQVKVKNDLTGVQTSNVWTMPTGWHRFEACARTSGATGEIRLYTDGVLRSTMATNIGTAPITGFRLFDDANRIFTGNVDDVVVDQAAG